MTGPQDSKDDYPFTDKLRYVSSLGSQGPSNNFVFKLDDLGGGLGGGNQGQELGGADLLCESSATFTGNVTYYASASLQSVSTSSTSAKETLRAVAQLASISTQQAVGKEVNNGTATLTSIVSVQTTGSRLLGASSVLSSISSVTKATASKTHFASVSLSSLSVVSYTAGSTNYGVAALICNPSTLYAGTKITRGNLSFASTSTLSSTALITIRAAASLTASCSVVLNANNINRGVINVSSVSSLQAQVNSVRAGVASLLVTSIISATANKIARGNVSLLGETVLTGTANKIARGNVSLLGEIALTGTANKINGANVILLTTVYLTANVNNINYAAAALVCNPAVLYSGTEINRATSTVTSISYLISSASNAIKAVASLVVTTTVTLIANKINRGSSSFASVAALEAEVNAKQAGVSSLSGLSSVTSLANKTANAASSLNVVAVTNATAVKVNRGVVSFNSQVDLTGDVNTTQKGIAVLLSSSSATSLASKTANSILFLSATSSSNAVAVETYRGVASFNSQVDLTGDVNTTQKGIAVLLSSSSTTSLASKTANGSASLVATSSSLLFASQLNRASSNCSVVVNLLASNNSEIGGSASLSSTGSVSSFASRIITADSGLIVTSVLTGMNSLSLFAVSSFASVSSLSGTGNNPNIDSSSSLEVVSSLVSFASQTYECFSAMQCESTLAASVDIISSSSADLVSVSLCGVDALVFRGGFAALICNATLNSNSVLRKNFYPDGLVIVTGGSADSSYAYIFLLETNWATRKSVEFTREFNWNTGQSPLRWYRVQGCCKYPTSQGSGDPLVYPNFPDPAIPGGCSVMGIETDDPLCVGSQGRQQFVQNLLGRSVGDICNQLNDSGLRWEICSIKQWSRPADATDTDDCNQLVEVPFKDIPECLDLALKSVYVNIAVRTYTIETIYFAVGSGGMTIGGSAITSSSVPSTQSSFEFNPTGLQILTGGSAITSSSWNNELTTTMGLLASIVDLNVVYGEGDAPELVLAPAPVNAVCGNCRSMPQVLYVHHNLNVSNPLVQFLNRNGLKMPNPVTLHYSRRLQSWTANVHLYGEGDDNLGSDESWRFSFEWSCVNEVAGDDLTGPSWKFSVLIVRKNEITGFDLDSRVMLIFPPEQICLGTTNLDFDFSFSFNTATKFVSSDSDVTANLVLLNDKIGLFKSKFWTLNPNLNIRLSRSNVSFVVARQDISSIFPSASTLNVATPFVTR